jgi:hypothetical protein
MRCAKSVSAPLSPTDKSLFASFSSEKEDSAFQNPNQAPLPMPILSRRSLLTRSAALGALTSCAPTVSDRPSRMAQVKMTLAGAANGPLISPRFLGLSYEKSMLSRGLFDPDDTAMIGLLRGLGQGVLRVGGNQVDRTLWRPRGPGGEAAFIAPADVERFAAFARATGWQVLYAINLGANDPAAAADEVVVASAALGDTLAGIEIGNEPDVFHANGLRDQSYDYARYAREWRRVADAIRARAPNVVLTGPASASNVRDFTLPFARDHGGEIDLLTQHYYRANGRLASSTVDVLLQPDPKLPGMLRSLAAAAAASHIKGGFRLAEANSYYNGGAPNVSNSFGGALWLLDFLINLAYGGAAGVNLHGGGNGPGYTPIGDDGRVPLEVRPEYVAMKLMAPLSGCTLIAAGVDADGLNLGACAARAPTGRTHLLFVNKDRSRAARGEVTLAAPADRAMMTRLIGDSLDSKLGVRLGGSAIAIDGDWSGTPEIIPVTGTRLAFDLPAATAVRAEL